MVEASVFILEKYGLAIFLVLVIVGLFTYLLKTLVMQWTEQSKSFINVIQNHLHTNTNTMIDVSKNLTNLSEKTTESFNIANKILATLNEKVANGSTDSKEAHRRERDEHEEIIREVKK